VECIATRLSEPKNNPSYIIVIRPPGDRTLPAFLRAAIMHSYSFLSLVQVRNSRMHYCYTCIMIGVVIRSMASFDIPEWHLVQSPLVQQCRSIRGAELMIQFRFLPRAKLSPGLYYPTLITGNARSAKNFNHVTDRRHSDVWGIHGGPL
jgi:hypothetical protein